MSVKAKLKQMEKWGEAGAIGSIQDTIANGWQGIFAPKGIPAKGPDEPNNEFSLPEPWGPEKVASYFAQVHGFDFVGDGSHVPGWDAQAAAAGMTRDQFIAWRIAWGEKHGPYSEELRVPRVAPPSMEAR